MKRNALLSREPSDCVSADSTPTLLAYKASLDDFTATTAMCRPTNQTAPLDISFLPRTDGHPEFLIIS